MKLNKTNAAALLRTAALEADGGIIDKNWFDKTAKLSELCAAGISKTHIAFLGTAMLAKAMDGNADLYAIKPAHAQDNPNAFSARTLCHQVLVPIAAELGISIGVTGREPLNNQPYFRMTRLGDDTPVHVGGREAFDYMLELIAELSAMQDQNEARAALSAYIAVRRTYQPRYVNEHCVSTVSPDELPRVIAEFVRADSEGGRRAQAIVAGLLDVFAGTGRVDSGRINDPSRKYPGDVCIRLVDQPDKWEKAFEVRDKPVSVSDVQIFGKKCIDMGVREAAVVMVADKQDDVDEIYLHQWASSFGLGLSLFHGWDAIVGQILFWARPPKPEAAVEAVARIAERLISLEVAPKSVDLWVAAVKPLRPDSEK